MSEENVEIVRRIYEATARGDTASVLAAYDENVEFDLSRSPFREFFPKHVVHGHEGLRAFFRERHEDWDWWEDECLGFARSGIGWSLKSLHAGKAERAASRPN